MQTSFESKLRIMTLSNGNIFLSTDRSPVNSPHKGQWCRALMFSLICAWINDWDSNREAGDLGPYRAHYDFIVMESRHGVHSSRRITTYFEISSAIFRNCVWTAKMIIGGWCTYGWFHSISCKDIGDAIYIYIHKYICTYLCNKHTCVNRLETMYAHLYML